jgi:hypothetical protein
MDLTQYLLSVSNKGVYSFLSDRKKILRIVSLNNYMETNGTTQKKKRGRKSKKKIETIPEISNGNESDKNNMVIKLSTPIEIQDVSHLQINEAYESQSHNLNDYGQQKTGELCWNCCHEFSDIITGIPMKYHGGIFYTYGDFCSLECCSRYAYEYLTDDFWEILSFINLYNRVLYGKFNAVEMAPSKLVLKRFGGELDIEDYRIKKNVHDIRLAPILPINHCNDVYEKKIMNNLDNLRLYRKKKLPSEKKNITNSMKLSVS